MGDGTHRELAANGRNPRSQPVINKICCAAVAVVLNHDNKRRLGNPFSST